MARQPSLNQIQAIYVAFYGRPADPSGQAYWADLLEQSGGELSNIIDAFADSDEYQERFGNDDPETLVNNLYRQAFARDAEPAGLQYWTGELEAARTTLGRIALDVLNGARNSDKATIDNKMAIADTFTQAANNSNKSYAGNDAITQAKALLDSVRFDTDLANQAELVQQVLADFAENDFRFGHEVLRFDTRGDTPVANPIDSTFSSHHQIDGVELTFSGNTFSGLIDIANMPDFSNNIRSGMSIAYAIGIDVDDDEQNEFFIKIVLPNYSSSNSYIEVRAGLEYQYDSAMNSANTILHYSHEPNTPLLNHEFDYQNDKVVFSMDLAAMEQQLLEQEYLLFAELISLITPESVNWVQSLDAGVYKTDDSFDMDINSFVYFL